MRRAVFAGSFDPVTTGHIDIVERAAAMFDELIVCIFHNVQKEGCFPLNDRIQFLREATAHVPNARVDVFSGLLTDYMKQQNARVVVRGLRSVKDFEYEENHAAMVRHLMPESDTIFLLTRPDLTFISSSGVRELIRFRGPVQGIVPPSVELAIMKLYGKPPRR
ncbi:pantetheine-phosphate adenylyltransferase [Centipeda periodontii DSM 2778]|uniref:Phosphopantetheine adenylyltransferase n=1 Tax=Centipeda periodontii DSM 2778 TaxID=888060 RepID=F5RM29_9FIRM|nr:pantetheine-phosphate adenylyltransferase [Centipeda periodontii]EGK59720.1 pantetheine-phosphate adenylyltransferase [Centipeda periodontii DSM 2778]